MEGIKMILNGRQKKILILGLVLLLAVMILPIWEKYVYTMKGGSLLNTGEIKFMPIFTRPYCYGNEMWRINYRYMTYEFVWVIVLTLGLIWVTADRKPVK